MHVTTRWLQNSRQLKTRRAHGYMSVYLCMRTKNVTEGDCQNDKYFYKPYDKLVLVMVSAVLVCDTFWERKFAKNSSVKRTTKYNESMLFCKGIT